MTYKVVRVKLGVWRDSFKDAEDDTSFDADSYPALDDYLTTMERRGWTVVNTAPGTTSSGTSCLFVTLHQPSAVGGSTFSEYSIP